ncbi:hypothetical protein FHS19_003317 [Paenibacillus rhizosphaerae]|uniref:Uncharacterized protein n=1 Tax=Paenibacillus rhizosphaerae TaxID=297318 RepID=A0A839TQ70_9BACL|nr:hypothetical protein [Paenibacillus rhizosphaerae]MBB3128663.1 hypothetical protein [Paenibacillus rhizosphaerae]
MSEPVVGMDTFKSVAISGRIPIMTNSAIPMANEHSAMASRDRSVAAGILVSVDDIRSNPLSAHDDLQDTSPRRRETDPILTSMISTTLIAA